MPGADMTDVCCVCGLELNARGLTMAEERKTSVRLEIEERPEGPFDVLHVALPLPRLPSLARETRQHLRAARRERLLALRSLLDAVIKRLEEGEQPYREAKNPELQ